MPALNDLYGPFGEPICIVVSGESGVGKTTDFLLSWPWALVLTMPGALHPAVKFWGARVPPGQIREVADLEQATIVLEQIGEARARGEFRWLAVYVDDLSELAERELAKIEPIYGPNKVFQKWDDMGRRVLRFADAARWAGVHLGCSAHVRAPSVSAKSGLIKGGPAMPGPSLTSRIPHIFDIVWLAVYDPDRRPWSGVYQCDAPNPRWHLKDRTNSVRGKAPMNLREIMRASGFVLPRPSGLEWMDDAAEQICGRILEGGDRLEVFKTSYTRLRDQVYDGHAYWAVRDGLDRAEIRTAKDLGFLALLDDNQAIGPAL